MSQDVSLDAVSNDVFEISLHRPDRMNALGVATCTALEQAVSEAAQRRARVVLFRGSGLVEWIGLVIVVQNIVGSLFNSHLFDFDQGWIYVLGVGVAGGAAWRGRRRPARRRSQGAGNWRRRPSRRAAAQVRA